MDIKLIIMKKCEAEFNFEQEMLSFYPVWIKMHKLDLALWNTRCISKLVSMIGRPLDIDENTRKVKRINYARVLVETKAHNALPTTVKAKNNKGNIYA